MKADVPACIQLDPDPDLEPAPCPGHCGCGQPFATAAAWERHAKASGCRHWRIDLPITKP